MMRFLLARLVEGQRTVAYPSREPTLPDRYRGRPLIDESKCPEECRACVDACPTDALVLDADGINLDMGRCLFCNDCAQACPDEAIGYSTEFRMATRSREDLVVRRRAGVECPLALDERLRRLFSRSLKLRQVSAGGCNGCESDVNVLGTIAFDLARFGVQIVASPRHADGLLVTGPVTENMKHALVRTYAAVPSPKLVIAVGACAISGGPFAGHPEVHDGADSVIPIDLYVPGCPPHPLTILDGLLRLLDKIDAQPGRLTQLP